MIVIYTLGIVSVLISILVFLAPAFAYHVEAIVNDMIVHNVTLFNLATGWNYTGQALPFEYNELAFSLLISSIITLIAMLLCTLLYTFYKSDTGLKIKRMIFADAVGLILTITDLIIVSLLVNQLKQQGQNIGLAFIFYYLSICAAIIFMIGEIGAIWNKFLVKYNWERFAELIAIEESMIPYIQDDYKKELAIANLKYMKRCHTAPKVSKQHLNERRQEVLKVMLEKPHECDCKHENHSKNCTCESHENEK